MRLAKLTATALLAATAVAFRFPEWDSDSVQSVFKGHKSKNPNKLYDRFVQIFSAERSGVDTYLQDQVEKMYPGQAVTVTQERGFDVLAWAAASEEPVLVRELPDCTHIKRTMFKRPQRRRDGPGTAAEMSVFGGWNVAWRDAEYDVIMATWIEGFGQVSQWHIVTKKKADAHTLIQEVMQFSTALRDVVWVFEMGGWRPDHELWEAVQKASWDDVVLDADFKKSIQNDYRTFFKSEATYKKLNVPWKRGLIFLGPPGNGKTISLKAIMREVDMPTLYVKTFHSFMGDEFSIREIFERARQEAPCILILEDLDSIVTDPNRSFFLNEVDGINENDGILMIGTTNHFDRLDPGLSNRPSRFDRKYTFPNPTKEQRQDYARYWQTKLKDNKEIEFPDDLVDEFADKTDDFSFAYMKEAFISTLLTLAAGEKDDFAAALMKQVEHLRKELEENPEVARVHDDHYGGGHEAGYVASHIGEPMGTVYRFPNVPRRRHM